MQYRSACLKKPEFPIFFNMLIPRHFTPLHGLYPLLLVLFFGAAACSGTQQLSQDQDDNDPQRDYSKMEELYWSRIDSSRMNFTQADVDFMHGMIPHHAQALVMSRLAPENDASRSVQVLSARIINAQSDEIELMQRWLEVRDQPVPEVHIDGLDLKIHMQQNGSNHQSNGHHAMHDHTDMPGMLSQDQLEELAAATGTEFDRKFLRFMIDHHKGAVIMAETLFAADGAASGREIFELASGINADQVTEIERMQQMLADLE